MHVYSMVSKVVFWGKNCCVVGYSWFSCVPCAIEHLKTGLYFTGIVKGHSSEFPKKFVHELAFHSDSKCGETRASHNNTECGIIMAHCWYEPGPDKPPRPGRPQRNPEIPMHRAVIHAFYFRLHHWTEKNRKIIMINIV